MRKIILYVALLMAISVAVTSGDVAIQARQKIRYNSEMIRRILCAFLLKGMKSD